MAGKGRPGPAPTRPILDQKKEKIAQYGNAFERSKLYKPKKREQCKQMYFAGMSAEEIEQASGVELDVLQYWILGANRQGVSPGCWFKIKDEKQCTIVDLFIKKKYEVLEETCGLALLLLKDQLGEKRREIEEEGKVLSIRELRGLSEIVSDLDKIARLESGQATEIINRAGLSAKEARKILENDPFSVGIVETEGKVVEEKND